MLRVLFGEILFDWILNLKQDQPSLKCEAETLSLRLDTASPVSASHLNWELLLFLRDISSLGSLRLRPCPRM